MQRITNPLVTEDRDLPANVAVVEMTNKQRLGGERIRLDINVRSCHLHHYISS